MEKIVFNACERQYLCNTVLMLCVTILWLFCRNSTTSATKWCRTTWTFSQTTPILNNDVNTESVPVSRCALDMSFDIRVRFFLSYRVGYTQFPPVRFHAASTQPRDDPTSQIVPTVNPLHHIPLYLQHTHYKKN